jgi:uncharacterized protein (TIGR03437 family)
MNLNVIQGAVSARVLAMVALALAVPANLLCQTNPVVRFQTNLGAIDVELFADVAPKTVANFLNYMDRGAYTNSIIHRSVANFVIQGGGFRFNGDDIVSIPQDAPVVNEYKVSNTRGTIAMAKLGDNPNSATNQWFFNTRDNSANLDAQNGGFTVFGKIVDAAGLAVMDSIARVPTYGTRFAETTPLINYRANAVAVPANFVTVQSIRLAARAISAGAFGAFREVAPGSYLELYGSGLSGSTRTWLDVDFRNGAAPTSLDEVDVTIGGIPAYVSYISPTQVNVQVPEGVSPGTDVPVVVTYKGQQKAVASVTVKPIAAGLLAPESFRVGDFQFVVAQHTNGQFVANASINGVAASPALAGEVITIYGVGFGPVLSGPVAGRIAEGQPRTQNRVQFFFDGKEAEVQYAGLVPGLVGLYQFNVVVPAGLGTRDVSLAATVAGSPLSQTLYIPVRE